MYPTMDSIILRMITGLSPASVMSSCEPETTDRINQSLGTALQERQLEGSTRDCRLQWLWGPATTYKCEKLQGCRKMELWAFDKLEETFLT